MATPWRRRILQKLSSPSPGTPKHVSLYQGFVEAIEFGALRPGQKIPTETELAQALPVSIGTIQRAIGSLVKDGLVVRRRGAGSFVAHPQKLLEQPLHCRFLGPDGFLPVYAELISRKLIAARGPWSQPLNQSGQSIVRIDRKISINREFHVLSRLYLDLLRFPWLMTCPLQELATANIKGLLTKRYRVSISHIEQSLQPESFSPTIQKLLAEEPTPGGVRLDLLAVETSGKAAMYQELYVPTNPYRLVISDKFGAGHEETAEPAASAPGEPSSPDKL